MYDYLRLALVVLITIIGCNSRPETARPVLADSTRSDSGIGRESGHIDSTSIARNHADPGRSLDSTYAAQDIVTKVPYIVEDRQGLLVLLSRGKILDTMETPDYAGDMYGHGFTIFDSTFLIFGGMYRGNSGTAVRQIICAANGHFQTSASFTSETHCPSGGEGNGYYVDTRLFRHPYRLKGSERYCQSDMGPCEKGHWREPVSLSFDDTAMVFYSDYIPLNNVPVHGEAMQFNGKFPAIVLKQSTEVFVSGKWYGLAQSDYYAFTATYEGEKLWASGHSPKVTEGNGSRGDTLSLLSY